MRWLLLYLCCLAMPGYAADAVRDCLNAVPPQSGKPVDLTLACPALVQPWQALVVAQADSHSVQAGQLQFWAKAEQPVRTTALNLGGLDGILAGIFDPSAEEARKQWWTRFLQWLDSLKGKDYDTQFQWFSGLLNGMTLSDETLAHLFYGLIALLVLVTLGLVSHELWLAEVFARWSGGRRKADQQTGVVLAAVSAPSDFGGLSPPQQIAALLAQVVEALAVREAIPRDATLTYRQLLRHLKPTRGVNPAAFTALVATAEPIVFGQQAADAQILAAYRRDAEALLAQQVS
ncbi:hypothetical protein AADEFJLK_00282 [Methylovulum psychrotolerans]|uniref:DUF4129 domain-containing protein n=2 Tax=Methylovulum psychrotolerans TaxID=1704499 RepID=A0A2S5CR36_9GAMM|nr:hypothetical protein AADEFJLK_00282 [Methylovulum psychrotolerans]